MSKATKNRLAKQMNNSLAPPDLEHPPAPSGASESDFWAKQISINKQQSTTKSDKHIKHTSESDFGWWRAGARKLLRPVEGGSLVLITCLL